MSPPQCCLHCGPYPATKLLALKDMLRYGWDLCPGPTLFVIKVCQTRVLCWSFIRENLAPTKAIPFTRHIHISHIHSKLNSCGTCGVVRRFYTADIFFDISCQPVYARATCSRGFGDIAREWTRRHLVALWCYGAIIACKIGASAVPILARDNFESDKVVNFNFRVSLSSLIALRCWNWNIKRDAFLILV